MRNGDTVRVLSLDDAASGPATGVVELISSNEQSIAVVFDDKPPFSIVGGGGMVLSPLLPPEACSLMLLTWRALCALHGLTLVAMREGPLWREVFGGKHFKIEPL